VSSSGGTSGSAVGASQTSTASGGMGIATKIGIGLGVPLGLIVLGLIFGIYWFGKRRGRQAPIAAAQTQEPMTEGSLHEAGGRPYHGSELWTGANVAEMPGHAKPAPLYRNNPAELHEGRRDWWRIRHSKSRLNHWVRRLNSSQVMEAVVQAVLPLWTT
jgi:hypothetical protein